MCISIYDGWITYEQSLQMKYFIILMQTNYSKRDDIMKNQLCVHKYYRQVLDIYNNYLCKQMHKQPKLPFNNQQQVNQFIQCIKYFFVYDSLYLNNPYKAGPNIKKKLQKSIIGTVISNSNSMLNPSSYTFQGTHHFVEDQQNQRQSAAVMSQMNDLANDSQMLQTNTNNEQPHERDLSLADISIKKQEIYVNDGQSDRSAFLLSEGTEKNKIHDNGQQLQQMNKTKQESKKMHDIIHSNQYSDELNGLEANILDKNIQLTQNISVVPVKQEIQRKKSQEKIQINEDIQNLLCPSEKIENISQDRNTSKLIIKKSIGKKVETKKGAKQQELSAVKIGANALQQIPQIDSDQAQQERLGIVNYAQRALKLINCNFMGTFGSNQIRRRPKQQKIFVQLENVFMIFDESGRNAFFDRANFQLFYEQKNSIHFPSGF